MGWLKDLGIGSLLGLPIDPVSGGMGAAYSMGQESESGPGASPAGMMNPATAGLYGTQALHDLTFNPDLSLRTPAYQGPGQVSQDAFSAMLARSQNDPLQRGAESYFGNILSGNASNPYLDATYKQSAGKIRGSLDSQFERAGRYGGTDHEAAMGGALGEMATNLYGGAYESNQGRMMQAAQIAPGIGYQGLAKQAALGQQQDMQGREAANWDYDQSIQRLNNYLSGSGQANTMMPPPEAESNDLANILGVVTAGASLFGGNPLPAASMAAGSQQQTSYDYNAPLPQYRTSWY